MANPEVTLADNTDHDQAYHPALCFFGKHYWRKIFAASCMFAVMLDPLFLYIPVINHDKSCLRLDKTLKVAALVSRLVTDLFYVMDILVQVYTSKHRPRLINEFGKREYSSFLATIAKMVRRSYIIIDFLAILPFPQVLIFIFFSKMRSSRSFNTNKFIMNFFLLVQYVPRVFRIYSSCNEPKRYADGESTAIWVKGLLNLFMYILASNVLGAVWYFFAIQRMVVCWQYACQIENGCDISTFSCHEHRAFTNITFLNSLCPIDTPGSKPFDFGIFLGILQSGIPRSTNFLLKLTYCFCWGLRNLSSLGSNLQPSTNIWENLFVAFVSIIGLLLFIYLIGNLQTYMQLETARKESRRHERKMKRKVDQIDQEIELWLSESFVPTELRVNVKSRILERVQQELDDNMNIGSLDYILSILPSQLQMYIKNCSPLNRLKQVPVLQDMDEEGLKAICNHLKPMKYTTNNIIIKEDEPLQLMLFIMDGVVSIERAYYYSNLRRGAGELCGEELLAWPALTSFPDILPSAIESARAMGNVEALVLMKSDMESLGINFSTHFKKFGSTAEGQQYIRRQKDRTQIFTKEDLRKATNNYHVVLGEGCYTIVHKGILPDKSVVAVKMSRGIRQDQSDYFINEVIASSSINHKNVVRLVGVCLEVKVPSLVFECITNGSLYEHIHKTNGKGSPPLTLELRIKVAVDIAGALAYLHSATPIIHGDVESTNILLDENYMAKLKGFEHSKLVAEGQDHLSTLTWEYWGPECDVYNFGIVLMELLTSKSAVSFDRPEKKSNLAAIFVDSVEEGRLDQILDHEIVNDGNFEKAAKVAGIAERCTRVRREERPSMKVAARELELLMGI